MAGNSIGQLFRVTTFGESHSPALGAIVDGVPPPVPPSPSVPPAPSTEGGSAPGFVPAPSPA